MRLPANPDEAKAAETRVAQTAMDRIAQLESDLADADRVSELVKAENATLRAQEQQTTLFIHSLEADLRDARVALAEAERALEYLSSDSAEGSKSARVADEALAAIQSAKGAGKVTK